MRKLLFLFIGIITHLIVYSNPVADNDKLLKTLDEEIKADQKYIEIKEANIANFKNSKLRKSISQEDIYFLNKSLFNEYKSYMSDSALAYLNENLRISTELRDYYKMNETNLAFSSLLTSLGLYPESLDALSLIHREYLDEAQKVYYYKYHLDIYGGIALYSHDTNRKAKFWRQNQRYIDSLYLVMPEGSSMHLLMEERLERERGSLEKALFINDKRLGLTQAGTEEYALIMFYRSLIYRKMGDMDKQKECLILSSISDVQCAIKDNASISILANMLFDEGDINRAYDYIRYSLDNIHIYNTRIRSSEVLDVLTIIDKTYHEKNEKKNMQLRNYFILICVLSIVLAVALYFIYRQKRKQENTNIYITKTNKDLASLNEQLKSVNSKLEKTNLKVIEANRIKEEYIGYFLNQCVRYVDQMNDFRKSVYRKVRDNQTKSLENLANSHIQKENELKELFANFDMMFLQLFPTFIDEFNNLLMEDEKIVLKEGEILNIELRIYALVRLGISDSTKIANALGYSVSTIYNYRTKMKNKAKPPREDFEWAVKRIGAYKK